METSSDLDVPHALLSHYSRIGTGKALNVLFNPANGVGSTDFAAAMQQQASEQPSPRGLHIRLPFCPVRCLDCDNETVVTHDADKIDRYIDRLEREIALTTGVIGHRPQLQQLHLGGGSPNYLKDHQLVRLMAIVDEYFEIDDDTDVSLDANPKRTSPNQLALLRGLGFNRIEFGIRDLDPTVQLAIGRTTSLEMIRDVFDNARDVGFETISTDIVYGLPCQTRAGVQRTIDNLLTLSPDRIACLAFTRRAAARAHQSAIDQCRVPSLADKLALFNTIVNGLSDDYEWIGLDSFAKSDDQLSVAQSENRLHKTCIGYSHLAPTDIHGLGTSAISDLEHVCVQNHLQIDPWEHALDADEFPIRGGIRLSDSHRAQRDAIRSLTCNMEVKDYAPLLENDEGAEAAWNKYAQEGLISITAEGMRVTDEGRYLLPHLLAH